MMQFETANEVYKHMTVARYEHTSCSVTSGISKMLHKITCTQVLNNNNGKEPTFHCRTF